jgi:hypothetical protein
MFALNYTNQIMSLATLCVAAVLAMPVRITKMGEIKIEAKRLNLNSE